MGAAGTKQFHSEKAKHAEKILSAVQHFDERHNINSVTDLEDSNNTEHFDGFAPELFKRRVLLAAAEAKQKDGIDIQESLDQLSDADMETLAHYIQENKSPAKIEHHNSHNSLREKSNKILINKSKSSLLKVEELYDEDDHHNYENNENNLNGLNLHHPNSNDKQDDKDETTSVLSYGDEELPDNEDSDIIESSGSIAVNILDSKRVNSDDHSIEDISTMMLNIEEYENNNHNKHAENKADDVNNDVMHELIPPAKSTTSSRRESKDGSSSKLFPLSPSKDSENISVAFSLLASEEKNESGKKEKRFNQSNRPYLDIKDTQYAKFWDNDSNSNSLASIASNNFSPSHQKSFRKSSSGSLNKMQIQQQYNNSSHAIIASSSELLMNGLGDRNESLLALQRQKVLSYTQNAQLEREVEELKKKLEIMEQLDRSMGLTYGGSLSSSLGMPIVPSSSVQSSSGMTNNSNNNTKPVGIAYKSSFEGQNASMQSNYFANNKSIRSGGMSPVLNNNQKSGDTSPYKPSIVRNSKMSSMYPIHEHATTTSSLNDTGDLDHTQKSSITFASSRSLADSKSSTVNSPGKLAFKQTTSSSSSDNENSSVGIGQNKQHQAAYHSEVQKRYSAIKNRAKHNLSHNSDSDDTFTNHHTSSNGSNITNAKAVNHSTPSITPGPVNSNATASGPPIILSPTRIAKHPPRRRDRANIGQPPSNSPGINGKGAVPKNDYYTSGTSTPVGGSSDEEMSASSQSQTYQFRPHTPTRRNNNNNDSEMSNKESSSNTFITPLEGQAIKTAKITRHHNHMNTAHRSQSIVTPHASNTNNLNEEVAHNTNNNNQHHDQQSKEADSFVITNSHPNSTNQASQPIVTPRHHHIHHHHNRRHHHNEDAKPVLPGGVVGVGIPVLDSSGNHVHESNTKQLADDKISTDNTSTKNGTLKKFNRRRRSLDDAKTDPSDDNNDSVIKISDDSLTVSSTVDQKKLLAIGVEGSRIGLRVDNNGPSNNNKKNNSVTPTHARATGTNASQNHYSVEKKGTSVNNNNNNNINGGNGSSHENTPTQQPLAIDATSGAVTVISSATAASISNSIATIREKRIRQRSQQQLNHASSTKALANKAHSDTEGEESNGSPLKSDRSTLSNIPLNNNNNNQSLWTEELENSWGEVSLLLRQPILSEADMHYAVASTEAGIIFTDQLNSLAKNLHVLRGALSRWLLPYDSNTRIESQCSTPHSVVENMPESLRGKLTERQVHYLVAGANGVRKLIRIKIADDNDLEQAREALRTADRFFKALYEKAKSAEKEPFELLMLGQS
eukprot:gene9406-12667_t